MVKQAIMKNKAKSTGHGKPPKKELRKVHVKSLSGHSLSFDIKSPGHGIDVNKGIRAELKFRVEMQHVIQAGVRIHPWTELDDEVITYHLVLALGPDNARLQTGTWRCNGCGHGYPHTRQVIVDVETGEQACPHSYCCFSRPTFGVDEEDEFLVKCNHCEAKGYLY